MYDPECLPPVESMDLLSFLVLETSYYSKDQFKAYRSLQSYNQLVSGFVSSVKGQKKDNKYIVSGKVRHSQRMNDPFVALWIITEHNGTVLYAHCVGCMAGQAECCSHIASVLFYIEAWNRINEKLTCTQVKCTWLLPTAVKEVPYAPIADIDFRSAKKLKRNLDETINNLTTTKGSTGKHSSEVAKVAAPVPGDTELMNFYAELNSCKTKAAALSLIHPFSDAFVSKSRNVPTISDLFDKKYLDFAYHDLLKACEKISPKITDEEVRLIEEDTRSQSKGSSFYRHRAGRIGASISKAACHTNPAQPSQSLIKTICYPNIFTFSTEATKHGCKHESAAIEAYEKIMKEKHINFQVTKCGTFINKQYPWLHATPDFLCRCDCCGDGCGEVKCPYCLKDTDLEQYINKYNSCLKSENGDASLKREHTYYYQTQQQIFTAGKLYCDFVVCGFYEQIDLFCERILPDVSHWLSVVSKLNHFWRYCVLPEILGRWYTQKRSLSHSSPDPNSACFCRVATGGPVVTYTNQACPISTFHLSCLKITKVPSKWFCPLCQKTPAAKNEKSKCKQTRDILDEALKLDFICTCKQKPLCSDKLLKCHNPFCQSGKFFHLPCLNFKRMPNNAMTTWECMVCKSGGKTEQGKKVVNDSFNTSDDGVVITRVSKCSSEKSASLAKLNDGHYRLISSPNGWLDCDIIHEVHVCLRNINPDVEGLQRPTLGPVRNFNQVNGEFIQILHTGNAHWVCVGTVGCEDGTVNLYDSFYHNIILNEVQEQVLNLVGHSNFTGIQVLPVQQQSNGSDCGVFAAAFATCLAYGIHPETVQFDVPKMRNHLYQSLKSGVLKMFPTF